MTAKASDTANESTTQDARFDLTTARLNAGYSIRGLARELRIAAPTLVRLEQGERVHPAIAKKVADFFDVKVTDLMSVDPGVSDPGRRAA